MQRAETGWRKRGLPEIMQSSQGPGGGSTAGSLTAPISQVNLQWCLSHPTHNECREKGRKDKRFHIAAGVTTAMLIWCPVTAEIPKAEMWNPQNIN
ncbi:hypothetical protein SKAU_G00271870 [Synaphobranchus kaupii]|uniref:Uncharacterized protein n=1 Tax=Synaphobranchus kaupii TaxID=118154 RepID=A0A9Q1INN0_SYNKA|nr:hypothetical protein SKAU_G00271870 [Synaphobranchus kaupii]